MGTTRLSLRKPREDDPDFKKIRLSFLPINPEFTSDFKTVPDNELRFIFSIGIPGHSVIVAAKTFVDGDTVIRIHRIPDDQVDALSTKTLIPKTASQYRRMEAINLVNQALVGTGDQLTALLKEHSLPDWRPAAEKSEVGNV